MLSNRRSLMPTAAGADLRGSNLARRASLGPEYSTKTEPHSKAPAVLTSTTSGLPGYSVVRVIGMIHGASTCSRKDSKSFLKGVGNGSESHGLTHMLYSARDQATERIAMDCITSGGNAIIGMTFEHTEIFGVAHIAVSGTAVCVEKQLAENPFSPRLRSRRFWELGAVGFAITTVKIEQATSIYDGVAVSELEYIDAGECEEFWSLD